MTEEGDNARVEPNISVLMLQNANHLVEDICMEKTFKATTTLFFYKIGQM